MSILNTIATVSNNISLGSSALSLIGMGTALFKKPIVKGIDGFLFDIKSTETINNTAQITNHFSEDNTYLHDHIAINPMTITLSGTIGELVFTKEAGLEFLKAMVNRLTPLGVLSPSQSAMATLALSRAETARSAYNSLSASLTGLADVVAGRETKTKQSAAYSTLEEIFKKRSKISVETPWQNFPDMVIESFSAEQSEDNTMETNFSVTLKQMRFVGVDMLSSIDVKNRYDAAISSISNKGIQAGESSDSGTTIAKTAGT